MPLPAVSAFGAANEPRPIAPVSNVDVVPSSQELYRPGLVTASLPAVSSMGPVRAPANGGGGNGGSAYGGPAAMSAPIPPIVAAPDSAALSARVAALEQRLASVDAQLARLYQK